MNLSDASAARICLAESTHALAPAKAERTVVPIERLSAAAAAGRAGRLPRRHVLMLVLAVEVLMLGVRYADRYRPPGVAVDQPFTKGHVIT